MSATTSPRIAGSRRMKWLALALLLAAGGLYILALSQRGQGPAWGYLAAFSEAAMVGACADWFAVAALFGHPLGLPIPHTAIIPSNKARIGTSLAAFICDHFLDTPQVLGKIRDFRAAGRLARWLADPQQAERLVGQGGAMLRYALGAFDDERVRTFFRSTVVDHLAQRDGARLLHHVLAALTGEERHQRLLDAVLRKLATVLDDDTLKARVTEIIANEVKVLRVVGLDVAAARYATAKIVAGLIRLVGEMGAQPDHPMRREFDSQVRQFVAKLAEDPDLRAKVAALQRELLASPALSGYLQGLWGDLLQWCRQDLDGPQSVLRERAGAAIRLVGETLRNDPAMQAWIDEQLLTVAPRWIERYREDIRQYIIARVDHWNTGDMTREVERNIGRDLQFIRINGTLVGGLVGLLIHAATDWLGR